MNGLSNAILLWRGGYEQKSRRNYRLENVIDRLAKVIFFPPEIVFESKSKGDILTPQRV